MLGTFIEASEHVTEWLAHSHQHNKDIVSSNMNSNFEILLTVSASHFLVNSNLIAMGQGYLLGRIWAMNAILEKSAPRSWPAKNWKFQLQTPISHSVKMLPTFVLKFSRFHLLIETIDE